MNFLEIQNLSKSYPGVQALKEVSFSIAPGHLHTLVGENGAGKSTLIKILSGAERPDSGSITINGEVYDPHNPKDALRSNVSTIYQVFNLLPDRSIMHNVMLGKEPRRGFGLLDLEAMRAETQRVLETLNAGYLSPDTPIHELKVGEKQIVEIAKALLNRSRLLIMDEPTSALNQTEVEALFARIRILKEQGVTLLYVSHRLEEIFQLADEVTVLRDGSHISTHPISEVTRDSLIEDMIGRKLEGIFPPRNPPQEQEALRVEGLSVYRLVNNVSFRLSAGEVLGIAGLPGSGKTELGQALFGALPLDGGQIWLNNQPFKPSPGNAIAHGLMYLPEDRKADGVMQELPVRRNLALAVLNRIAPFGFIDSARERATAEQQIRTLSIKTPHMEQLALNLSGGNQQKVALGKCLATDPKILILSEPTQGIDVGAKFEFYQFIVENAAAGCAVILISSELTELLGLAHRILVMHNGQISAELDGTAATQAEILRYALGEQTESRGSETESITSR
jgi:ribose transport system ATP-binding protein